MNFRGERDGRDRSSWRGWVAALGLSLAMPGASFAQEMKGPAMEKDAPSAKSKLDELKKARKKAEAVKPAEPAVKPQKNADGKYTWATPDDVNYIDEMLSEEWKYLGFPVAPAASEGEFLRRVSLDLLGRVPTYEEVLEFQKDKSPQRRENLVNRHLAHEDFGRHLSNVWTKLLMPNIGEEFERGPNQRLNRPAMHAWLQREFNRNTPWNEVVSQMLGATGKWDENAAVNFIVATMDREKTADVTSFSSKLFLGVQLQCTECHAHPWNEWKQEHFHGLNAFFLGTREHRAVTTNEQGILSTDYYELEEVPFSELKEKGTSFEMRNGLMVYLSPKYLDGRDANDIMRGAKARTAANKLAALDGFGNNLDFLSDDDIKSDGGDAVYLRQLLAKVITADDNPYFARAIVNRMWYQCFGHSFIKNVDDFDNGQDEPSMPDLLDRLAADFKANGYDLKRLLRWICTSDAYAMSTRRRGDGKDAIGFFTFQLPKPMTVEQLYDSLMTLTQYTKASSSADGSEERRRFIREMSTTFATDDVPTTTPKYDGTITQALMLMNSRLINDATSPKQGTFLHRVMSDNSSMDDKVDAIYMAALCRKPTGAERQQIAQLFNVGGGDASCPVCGGKVNPRFSFKVNGQTVGFKGAGCLAEFQKNPGKYAVGGGSSPLQDVMWAVINSSEFIINH